ncbi:hypothetical protein [Kitasatospora sp. NPDC002965]|uniref:hypothetical protein n=1 Tax=unclassified Kitasatospora TaxID=2633591 RepID=UPI0033B59EEC
MPKIGSGTAAGGESLLTATSEYSDDAFGASRLDGDGVLPQNSAASSVRAAIPSFG